MPLLDALRELDPDKLDIGELIKNAAKESGFEFLFEMPSALFDNEKINAFVLRCSCNEQLFHSFIVHDPDDNVFAIMNYEEIPPKARHFFASYHSVLSCLSKLPAVRKLN